MGSGRTRIELCGQLAVEIEGERIEGSLRGRQGRLLLAYLVLNRQRPVRRDELVDALWSEAGPPEGGDAMLAPPLSRLRRALGDGRLQGRSELSLVLPDDAWVDWEVARAGVTEARAALAGGEPRAAFEASAGALEIADRGLLPGLEAAWIDVRRAELGDLRLEALEVRAAAGAAMGGPEQNEAERAARAAVEAAPFRESSRAALMECCTHAATSPRRCGSSRTCGCCCVVRLTLKALDASRIAATFVTVGAKRTAYRKPLVVPAKRLAKLRYGSVDVWGNAEAARKAPRPGR